jgi:hypothetical protein
MLVDILKKIPDPRDAEGREYQLWEVLFVTILALLANAKGYSDVARFIEVHFETLKERLNLKWRRPPVISAIQKILVRINPKDVEEAFRMHSEKLNDQCNNISEEKKTFTPKKHICFDGKKLNGSFSKARNKRAQEIFNIFAAQTQIVLGHVSLDDKDSEIPALQELVASLNLEEVVITADAIHCQKKLLKKQKKQAQSS